MVEQQSLLHAQTGEANVLDRNEMDAVAVQWHDYEKRDINNSTMG